MADNRQMIKQLEIKMLGIWDETYHPPANCMPILSSFFAPFFFLFRLFSILEIAKGSAGLRISRSPTERRAQDEEAIRAEIFLPLAVRLPNKNWWKIFADLEWASTIFILKSIRNHVCRGKKMIKTYRINWKLTLSANGIAYREM